MFSSRIEKGILWSCALILIAGCNATTSTKHLTPSTAKSMLVAKLAADKGNTYTIDVSNLRKAMQGRTFDNYYKVKEPDTLGQGIFSYSNPDAAVQRLLNAGYVTQSQYSYKVPDVSGTYSFLRRTSSGGMLWKLTVVLSSKPSSDLISGNYTLNSYNWGSWSSSITGKVYPYGGKFHSYAMVNVVYGQTINNMRKAIMYSFASINGVKTLRGAEPFNFSDGGSTNITLTAHASQGQVNVKQYSYAFSSKLKGLLSPDQGTLVGGVIKVDGVTDLLLTTDTVAHAEFGWHVRLNGAGRVLMREASVRGTGSVLFGKEPDGDWVVTQYSLGSSQ